MKCVYIVAIPEGSGGMLISGAYCYASREAAEMQLAKDRQRGIDDTEIFTLYVEE